MRLNRPLLRLPRRYCAETLAAEIAALPRAAWLPHPGRLAGNDAVPLITPGGQMVNGFAGPMAPTEALLACPYIMEVMADLGAVWGRSRLMGLAAAAEVPEHVDVGYYWRTHVRVHVPIITSPAVSFSCAGETVHMAAGECWVFDTFQMHCVRNGGDDKRVHLVLDTVGGETLWDLVAEAQTSAPPEVRFVKPGTLSAAPLAFEQHNLPHIMSGWEVRSHIDYLVRQAPASAELDAISARLDRFAHGWMAAWAQHGGSDAGIAEFRRLIDDVRKELKALRASTIVLPNLVPLDRALAELVFQVAVPAVPPSIALAAHR
ncbi:hypothetical protein FHS96_004376 [Sphingomonas zeicaulis]|uniref:aspartyl/asparaginyl beta-hydroxylase domain-containing protein n=1 Tax=Sphingomonas zeicaulis TaxID=1632740 RepID=UPI003D1F0BE7